MSDFKQQGLALDEIEPPYDDPDKQPQTLTRTRHIDNVLYVAGRAPIEGQAEYDIMFIAGAVEEDEATQHSVTTFGFRINQPAEYLKGPNGIVRDVAMRGGLDLDKCYYTAVCKWLLPRLKRAKPPVKILKWGLPILMDEIKRVKPKIIVCMGKQPFDLLSDRKIGFDDAHGGWFWSTEANAHIYLMHAPYTLVSKPEYYERFRIDFQEIARKREILEHGPIADIPVRYEVIRDEQSLRDWVAKMEELVGYADHTTKVLAPENIRKETHHGPTPPGDDYHCWMEIEAGVWRPKVVQELIEKHSPGWPGIYDDDGNMLLAVDCEWHGRTHVDGQLRTIQLAWSESDAVVIEFRNEQNEWSFALDYEGDTDAYNYAAVGKILAQFLNRKDIRYVGHHFSADAPWMQHWLGLETYQRCVLDTEFAQQTIDESSELGLERGIAMKYTTLGLYNLDLVLWKKDNPGKTDDGYGFIPSELILPYSVYDVITPLRAYPLIRRQLDAQQLWTYYRTIFNPFVTDVFTEFTMVGLPMDVKLMDELRELFHFARRQLEVHFKERVFTEAKRTMLGAALHQLPADALQAVFKAVNAKELEASAIMDLIKLHVPLADIPKWIARVGHLVDAPNFNIRSPDMMRRWLFDVEGLEPIKSTNQKAKGLPSMSWEKVLDLPPDRQRQFTPAVDKQTLQILSIEFRTLDELLNLNAVGNVCKAFLKEADVEIDDETGQETKAENGLHQWLASDMRVHGLMSCTETSRSRSWRPLDNQ